MQWVDCVSSPYGLGAAKEPPETQESRFYPRKAFPTVRDRVFDVVKFGQEVCGHEDIK